MVSPGYMCNHYGVIWQCQIVIMMPQCFWQNFVRQGVVREALRILDRRVGNCVFQAVATHCGDVKLTQMQADTCCQPEAGDPDTRTHTLAYTKIH